MLLAEDTFDPATVTPGFIRFLVIALLALALFFLLRSMSQHLGKVSFDERRPEQGPGRGDASEPAAGAAEPRSDA